MIEWNRQLIADETAARLCRCRPELEAHHGPRGRALYVERVRQLLPFLADALDHDADSLFFDYIAWLRVFLDSHEPAPEFLADCLVCLAEVAPPLLAPARGARAGALLEQARRHLEQQPNDQDQSLIVGDGPVATLARAYLGALLEGERRRASRLVLEQVEGGMAIRQVYLEIFQPVLREIGRLWHTNQITVAVEHFATAATQSTMSQLYPYLFTGRPRGRTMVATCVSGELHEVGMRMVADCFEMDGWDSYYLGANIPAGDVVATLRQRQASVLGISATLSRHLTDVARLVSLARAELGAGLTILVGGYPFNLDQQLWHRIGADGMATDAAGAVAVVAAIEAAR